MLEKFRILTGYGDVYWPFWAMAILFFVGWDTVSTQYGIEVWHMRESVPTSKFLIDNYGYLGFAIAKLIVLGVMFAILHLIPDTVYTLNGTIPINEEYLKDVYVPLAITALGLFATVYNFLLGT